MDLVIAPGGAIRCIYGELVELASFGTLSIARASHVEPRQDGQWLADLTLVGGPVFGPFSFRSDALAAEQAWLEANWLNRVG